VVALGVFALGLPPMGEWHAEGRERARALLSRVQVKPPEWRLFGPNVHKTNTELSAEITLASGGVRHWRSPDFGERTPIRRFREGQLPKFYDNVRRDKNRAAWRPFAAWVAREAAPGERVVRVRLVRTVTELAAPGRDGDERVVRHAFYERWFR
jgi:hypothetical protein